MTFLPVVGREMLALSRRRGTYWVRVVMGLVAIGVMVYLLFLSYSQITFAEQGKSVFIILSSLSFIYSLLAGVVATSDCVSEEKREGTLGLLFLTDLKGYDVVFGKLTASSLNAALGLMAIVPVLAIALMLGGVRPQDVGLDAMVLANTLFLSLAAGVLVSTYCKNERRAMLACITVLLLIVIGPYLAALAATQFEHLPEEFVWGSPVYTFLCLHATGPARIDPSYFWISVMAQHCLAWLLLAWSSGTVPKFINELPRMRFQKLQRAFHQWVFGTERKRLKHRRQLLDRNAFMWLASRERVKKQYAWSMLVFFGALYCWIYAQYPQMGLDLPVAGVILFLTHILFKLWLASEVSSRLIEDRRSGALELLLTTPMTIRDMARGQQMALWRIFGAPVMTLIAAELYLFYATYKWRGNDEVWTFYGAAISTLLLDLWALKWVGLWNSLFGKSIERVLTATLVRVLGFAWIIFALVAGLLAALAHGVGYEIKDVQMLRLWWAISVIVSLLAGATARSSFLAHFRDAAAARFDSKPSIQSSFHLWLADTFGRFRFLTQATRKLPAPMRRRPVVSAVLAIIVLLFSVTYSRQVYWEHKLNDRLAAIRDRGEPTQTSEIPKYIPPVAANENGLAKLQEAGAVSWFGLNMANVSLEKRLSDDEKERLEKALGLNAVPLAAVRSLTNYAKGYRLIDPSMNAQLGGFNILYGYPHLLRMETLAAFHSYTDSNSDPAARARVEADMNALLALARLTRQVPSDDAQSTCFSSLEGFKFALERTFQAMRFDRAALEKIEAELERIEQPDLFQKKLVVLRAMALDIRGNLNAPGLPQNQQILFAAMGGIMKTVGIKDRIICKSLDRIDEILQVANSDFQQCIEKYASPPVPPQGNRKAPFIEESLSSTINLEAAIRAELRVLKAAIAVEKYRLATTALPSEWSRLTPAYLKEIPKDPFGGGAPLVLKHEVNKMLIYSVSANRQDDNGQNAGWYVSGDIGFKFDEP